MNAGIVLALVVASILMYAFYMRLTTPAPDPFRVDESGDLLGEIIQVQVLNGSGVKDLGRQMREHLIGLGFDVVETDNYSHFNVEKTVILDRVGNLDAAEQVALAIGLLPEDVTPEVVKEYYLDATVLIGHNYQQVLPWKLPEPELPEDEQEETATTG